MKTKKDKFEPVGVERMTDAELSKKLGHYQRTESIGILLGVLLVIAGCISMFIQRDPILVCALAFPGVALFSCHDHQFVQTTANRIIEILPNGSLVDKITTYDEYLASDEMARKRTVFTAQTEDDEN